MSFIALSSPSKWKKLINHKMAGFLSIFKYFSPGDLFWIPNSSQNLHCYSQIQKMNIKKKYILNLIKIRFWMSSLLKQSSPPPPPLSPTFSNFHTIFAVAPLVFAVAKLWIRHWKAHESTKKIFKIGPLQPLEIA